MSRLLKPALLIGLPLAAAAAFVGWSLRQGHDATQSVERSFAVDLPFDVVRKVLVRKPEAAQRIITAAGTSEFLGQESDDTDIAFDSLNVLKDYRINRTGTLRLRTKDEYVGEHEIELDQTVELMNDHVDSRATLREPAGRLLAYDTTTRFERTEDGTTRVALTLTQTIHTHAPWFAAGVADRRVRASAEAALAAQETGIRQVIDEFKDEFLEPEPPPGEPGERKRPLRGLLRKLIERAGEEINEPPSDT